MKGNTKYLVEFEATKKLVVPAQSEAEALEKAAKRVGKFWKTANARPIFAESKAGE